MNNTVVITGTASGIGRATVEKFVAEGWNVVATVRKDADLEVHQHLDRVRTLLLDVDDESAAPGFAEQAIAQFGQVDVLVNNAGYYQMGPLEASTSDQIHRQFQTNVFGLIALTRAFLPHFRTRRTGVIVSLSSISAEQGYPFTSVYQASKAAVASLTEGLNIELAPFNASAKAVFPGSHNTRIFSKMDIAQDIPDDYQAALDAFFNTPQASYGSSPEVAAGVIYRAATDGQPQQVRYYAGPDSEIIPRAKQLLGPQWYWEEFRAANTTGGSVLWSSLNRTGDGTALEKNL
ncbi:SDR family oxidoreductase [Nocardia jiangxiensis]|uniref:SDR family oxidoreductase n=1 Tax=Nocardia jiangxiensis TaxID=282685 RepID=A0ABW6SCG9_9NOCA|nr:SDR family oxidoreductase [Nocardia jiangxiensis]